MSVFPGVDGRLHDKIRCTALLVHSILANLGLQPAKMGAPLC